MKFTYISILILFIPIFLSAQNIEEQGSDSLFQNQISEEIELNQALSFLEQDTVNKATTNVASRIKIKHYPTYEKYLNAYAKIKRALKKDSLNHELQYKCGLTAVACGEYDAALKNFNKAVVLSPSTFEYYYGRGIARVRVKGLIAAINDFKKALQLNPNHGASYVYLGGISYDLNRFDTAIKYYNKAITLMPLSNVYYYRATSYLALQDKEAAIKNLNASKKLHPNLTKASDYLLNLISEEEKNEFTHDAVYYTNLGNSKCNTSYYQDAILCYKRAISIDSTFSKAHNRLGSIYILLSDYFIAIVHLQKAIEIDENLTKGHYDLGRAYFGAKQYDKAIQSLDRAIALESHFPKAYYYRGLANEQLNQLVEAKNDMEKAIKQKGHYQEARRKLNQFEKKLRGK